MTGNREVITGNDFKRMIAGAYSAFLLEYENINALNADSLMDEKAGTHIYVQLVQLQCLFVIYRQIALVEYLNV